MLKFVKFIAFLLALLIELSTGSINILDVSQPERGIVTLSLQDLSNTHGVISGTANKCDQQTDCDPYFIITLTDDNRNELFTATTQAWRNRNNLPFVFFNESIAFNESLPSVLHLRIKVMDEHFTGDQLIADLDQQFKLERPGWPVVFKLSTSNKFVSVTANSTFLCADSYYGPACAHFCQATRNLTKCRADGSLVCLDGSMNCLTRAAPTVREGKSVSGTAERVEVPRTLIYWVIPGVSFGLLLIVLLGLLVRLFRSRSDKIIVTAPDASPETGADPEFLGPPLEQPNFENRQLPDNIDILRSPTLLLAPADNQRFRNPVYSALRGSSHAARSSSVTTQSTAVSVSVAGSPAAVSRDLADAADAAELDEYDDLDEVLSSGDGKPLPTAASPNAQGRPLPSPGIF